MSEAPATRARLGWTVLLVLAALGGLPLAVWADLTRLSEEQLGRYAGDMGRIIDAVRGFYASDVAGRVVAAHGENITTSAEFRSTPGAIPIPASFSLELAEIFKNQNGAIAYRFVSDLPFTGRAGHQLDRFETMALATFRADPKGLVSEVTGTALNRVVRIATPVLMAKPCVDCHNSHPDSPKRDWKVGDVRAIQAISVNQEIGGNLGVFRWLLIYLLLLAAAGIGVIALQRRHAREIAAANRDLSTANEFLAAISMKIAKYISPQVYKSIFSGQKDVVVATERKKLTIFFSDIMDFTATTEQMQPEDLTAILNEYFTEMALIAEAHGGTVDKFIGDAVLVFFGDPETKGVAEDARAALAMALAMQRRIAELGELWRARGVERPFRARMGLNTGYCNVGNFGSSDRLDYTIIGAEANLAARLQAAAEPGGIVMSYETFAHVRDMVEARPMPPIRMKGISREVVPYAVVPEAGPETASTVAVRLPGFDLRVDPGAMSDEQRAAAREALARAAEMVG